MNYRLLYSETVRNQIRNLHPELKAVIRTRLKELAGYPYNGKKLEKELAGYYSLRANRYRIIYKIREQEHTIEIHYVGHRKDIYEVLRELKE